MPEKRVPAQHDRGGGRVKSPGGRDTRDRRQATTRHEKLGRRAVEQEFDPDGDRAQGRQRPSADDGQGDRERAPRRDKSSDRTSERDTAEDADPAVRRRTPGERDDQDSGGQADDHDRGEAEVGQFPQDHLSAKDAANAGMRGLAEVIGNKVVGVTELSPRHDGWIVAVEVLELERLPSSADILGLYEAELDMDGTLRSYRRIKRYTRGHGDGSGNN